MKQYITRAENGFVDASWLNEIKDSLNGGKALFHIYTGISDREIFIALMKTLREAFPSCNVVGTESGGEIREGSLMDKGILISCLVFERTEISIRIYDGLAGQERMIGSRIREEIDGEVSHDLKAVELLLPGALLNTLDMYEELKHCDPSVVIFGGYAGNHDADLANAFVMADGKTYTNACVAVFYYGKDFRIDAAKSAGWEKLGMPFKITSAEGNLLREINGIPAADIYQRYLNITVDDDFIDNTNEFPIAAYVGDEEILRHTNTVMEDGSLLLAGSVLEGWDMYLTFGNPTGIIDEVNRRLKQIHAFNPQAILLYSCYVRKLFWERFVNVELEPFQKIAPSAGFNTFGEVLRNMKTGEIMEYNITLLSIAMREGDAEPREDAVPYADDAILSGQSSLIKRLAKLVSSSTMEIQNAYRNLEAMNEQLKYASEHDTLTGLYNRGRTEELIEEMMRESRETKKTTSLIMFDIDHFKKVNDTYGHRKGDKVLREIAEIAESMLDAEKGEAAGRWGGEEFFIVLLDNESVSGREFAERFRRAVEEHDFGDGLRITVSLGVMDVTGNEEPKHVYAQIDDALYEAKENGRNRTIEVK